MAMAEIGHNSYTGGSSEWRSMCPLKHFHLFAASITADDAYFEMTLITLKQ